MKIRYAPPGYDPTTIERPMPGPSCRTYLFLFMLGMVLIAYAGLGFVAFAPKPTPKVPEVLAYPTDGITAEPTRGKVKRTPLPTETATPTPKQTYTLTPTATEHQEEIPGAQRATNTPTITPTATKKVKVRPTAKPRVVRPSSGQPRPPADNSVHTITSSIDPVVAPASNPYVGSGSAPLPVQGNTGVVPVAPTATATPTMIGVPLGAPPTDAILTLTALAPTATATATVTQIPTDLPTATPTFTSTWTETPTWTPTETATP